MACPKWFKIVDDKASEGTTTVASAEMKTEQRADASHNSPQINDSPVEIQPAASAPVIRELLDAEFSGGDRDDRCNDTDDL